MGYRCVLALAAKWPVVLQLLGAAAVAFGVGMLAGLAWGVVAFGLEAVVTGTLAEAEQRAPRPARPPRGSLGGTA